MGISYQKKRQTPKRNVVSSSLAGGATSNAEIPIFEGFLRCLFLFLLCRFSLNPQRYASRSTRIWQCATERIKGRGDITPHLIRGLDI